MNVVQMHNRTYFFLDSIKSPRFPSRQVDEAINSAINKIITDRYLAIKRNPGYAFQSNQRLRDELYTLVQKSAEIAAAGGIIPIANFPVNYKFLLNCKIKVSGSWYFTIPMTYDEMSMIERDPFQRPTIRYPERCYRIESAVGLEFEFGDSGALEKAILYYIKKPATVAIGTESNPGTLSAGTYIALTDIVWDNIPPTDPVSSQSGTVITPGASWTLSSGIVVSGHTNSDVPETLHDEVCSTAAQILSGVVENFDRERSIQSLNEDVPLQVRNQ
jgi:hypothetical protein